MNETLENTLKDREYLKGIPKTYDYDKFGFYDFNRKISKENLDRIKKSIERAYYPQPIIVSPTFKIIDGQHRFYAYKSLCLPIYYIMQPKEATAEDIISINSASKKWSCVDFITSKASVDGEFKKLLKFMMDFSMFPSAFIINVANGTGKKVTSNGGYLTLKSILKSDFIFDESARSDKSLLELMYIADYAKRNNLIIKDKVYTQNFAFGYRRLSFTVGFDFERFKAKLAKNKFTVQGGSVEYFQHFVAIYNQGLRAEQKISIAL